MKQFIVLVTSALLGLVVAQVDFNSECPTQMAASNFSLPNVLGVWHEAKRYGGNNDSNDCVAVNITEAPNHSLQIVESYKVLPNKTQLTYNQTATLDYPNVGELRFTGSDGKFKNYLILSTDYKNYALLWSCEPVPQKNQSTRKLLIKN